MTTDESDKTIPPQRPAGNDFDVDKTISPQRLAGSTDDQDKTMPGHHDRKTDGRFAVGDLIMRRYKVLAELGQGGMGVVYKCFDETAGIEVALKALPPELSHNTLEMEDIKDNFQLVHNLHHPNIASLNNLERNPVNGNYYLIMECCEGEDLRRWIKRKHRDRSMTWEEFLSVIRQVANALDYAHGEKVMHRDIKPGNIMINSDGKVKVLDFGLAAQIHTSMTRVSMAYRGTSGTGPYMAPEQWRGRAQGAAADQYALAVMAYEMLAGSLPFASSDPAVLQQAVLTQQADPIEGLPEYTQNALDRALSKEAADRFNSCADFAAALGGESVAAPQRVEADTPPPANANDPEQEDPLLTRASLFLESGDFRSAKEYCERVLDRDPKNGEAYFIRLLAELKLKKQDDLLNASKLDRNQTFFLVLKFAGAERKQELETLLQKWKDKAREKARARAKILKRIGVITGICVLICLLAGGFFAYEVWQDHKAVEALKKAAAEQNLVLSYNGKTVTGVTDETVTSVVIPDGVMRIGDRAFEGCENLRSITIPDSVTSIGDGAFRGCSKLTSVTIGNGVTSIGNRAFQSCTALRSITIPDSVTNIGFRAFYGVKFIKVLTGNPVYSVDERSVLINKKEKKLLYAPCSLSGSYTVPSSVTSIGDRAFEGCENLTSITIPDSVTSIGYEVFRGCSKLTSIVVPTHFGSVDVPYGCKIYHSVEEKAKAEAAAIRAEAEARARAEARAKAEAEERKIKEEPKKTIYLDSGVSLTMIGVAPGSFMMGSENGDSDEKPVHQVTLTQAYYLGETEVTQAQWRAVMGNNPSDFQGDDRPVEKVSWDDAMAFCRKLNDEGKAPRGWKFTLPTEAQWEYAARGGKRSGGYTYSGSNDVDDVAWYTSNSGWETHAVRQKRANELDLYDMSGNVWEWCLDGKRSYSSSAVTDPQGPQGPVSSFSGRVLRGGSWSYYAGSCRVADRGYGRPDNRYGSDGFRLALVPVQ